jgi:hypothetical protein
MVELRRWQTEALDVLRQQWRPGQAVVVRAVMGAGKSILMATVAAKMKGSILVTAPSVKLVDQLATTLGEVTGEPIGRYFTHSKTIERITVCCYPSILALADTGYTCNVWIADECHRTETDKTHAAMQKLGAQWILGFSATPYRSQEGETLSLFDRQIYEYSVAHAIRDGVVVPPDVRYYGGESNDINTACLEMIQDAEGPGIISAKSIDDAEEFARFADRHGFFSRAIHSKQSREEQVELIEMLRDGMLHHLVHVNMLTEGVDLPWLRWLCARRPSVSRIRFAQEIGRVLRSHPGKTRGVIYDVNNLFAKRKLTYEEALGEAPMPEQTDDEAAAWALDFVIQEVKEAKEGMGRDQYVHGVPAKILEPAASYIRTTRILFQVCGYIQMSITPGVWQTQPVSVAQMDMLERVGVQLPLWLPKHHGRALFTAIRAAHVLSKGDVSDLISVLKALKKMDKWPMEVVE